MNRTLIWSRRIATALLALLPSCVGTETGNPPVATIELGIPKSSDAPPDVTVSAATLGVARLELTPCATPAEVIVLDTAIGLTVEEPARFEIAPGRYCEITIVAAPAPLPPDARRPNGPPELAFAVVGSAGEVRFSFEDPVEATIALGPADVVAGDRVRLEFDLRTFVTEAGFAELQATPPGDVAVVDQQNNVDVYLGGRELWTTSWSVVFVDSP